MNSRVGGDAVVETSLQGQVAHARMIIAGQPVDTADRYELRNPANGHLVATVAKGDRSHVDRAVAAAKTAFDDGQWRSMLPDARAEIFHRASRELQARASELALLQSREIGVPVKLAAAFHVGLPIPQLDYFAELARGYEFERRGPDYEVVQADGYVIREPFGVCAAIIPWNIPLLVAIWKVAPALLTGNTMVIKPDEKAPLLVIELVQALHEAGLPDGVLNL